MLRITAILLAAAAAGLAQAAQGPPSYEKDSQATQARPGPGGQDVLWMNPLLWTWVKSDRDDTEIYFHETGVVQARLIVVREGKPPKAQLEDTLDRIRKVDPEAYVAFEEERIVNGAPVLCIQIVADGNEDREMVYYGYLYGSGERSVQLFTIAPRAALSELYVELTSLLNGLEIREKAAP